MRKNISTNGTFHLIVKSILGKLYCTLNLKSTHTVNFVEIGIQMNGQHKKEPLLSRRGLILFFFLLEVVRYFII